MAADSFQVESSRPDLVIKHAIRLVGTVETFQPYVDVIFFYEEAWIRFLEKNS